MSIINCKLVSALKYSNHYTITLQYEIDKVKYNRSFNVDRDIHNDTIIDDYNIKIGCYNNTIELLRDFKPFPKYKERVNSLIDSNFNKMKDLIGQRNEREYQLMKARNK